MVAILLILVWWWKQTEEQLGSEYVITKKPFKVVLTASGTVVAQRQATLKFQSSGQLAWVGVKESDWVKKWQGVASLDKRTVEKSLQKELNNFLKTRWDFEANREVWLVTTDNLDRYTLSSAARRVLEKSQFDVNNAVLDVEIQAVAAELSTLIAPFDGLVVDVAEPNAGVNVSPTSEIMTIVDPQSVYFEVLVDELLISKVKVGQLVEVTLDAYPDESFQAQVRQMGFVSVPLLGGGMGYVVKVDLPNPPEALRYKLGMNGDAMITVKEVSEALTLPVEAVRQKQGKYVVDKLVDGKVVEVEIKIGGESDEEIEIVEGLSEGERVVVGEARK